MPVTPTRCQGATSPVRSPGAGWPGMGVKGGQGRPWGTCQGGGTRPKAATAATSQAAGFHVLL